MIGSDPNPRFGLRLLQYAGGAIDGKWYSDALYATTAIGELSQAEWRTKEFDKFTIGDVSARPWLCIGVISGKGFDVRIRNLMVQKDEPHAWAPAEGEVWP